MKSAILMMAYGGPNSLADIEAYLLDIRGGRPTSAELVAEIRERYAQIGGRSPLLEITRTQAAALEDELNMQVPSADGTDSFRVYVGMRHWKPYIQEVVAKIAEDGFRNGVAFCMAPHASKMSSGAYRQRLESGLGMLPDPPVLDFIESWYDQPFLITSLGDKVRNALQQFARRDQPAVHYLFTAHSLPASLRDQGDPYAGQLEQTTQLLVRQLGLRPDQWSFAYQSAGAAPGQWLGPAIEEALPALAAQDPACAGNAGWIHRRPCGNFIRSGHRSSSDCPSGWSSPGAQPILKRLSRFHSGVSPVHPGKGSHSL